MKRSDRLGVIVVGAGLMGRWHADAAVRSGGRLLAVVDSDPARGRILAARHSTCSAEENLAEALDRRPTQVVHLCTPTTTHEPLVAAAVQAGCHVLVEKPLAPTLAVTKRLLDLAAAHRVLLCPVHQFLFQTGVLDSFRRLPHLGAVRHLDVVICSAGADGESDGGRDKVACDILPHPFSLLARLLGSRFSEMSWHVGRSTPGELRITGLTAGVTTGIVVSMSGRPTLNVLRIICEGGSIECDLFHGFATVERGITSRTWKIVRPFSTSAVTLLSASKNLGHRVLAAEYAYPGLRELVRRFYRAIADGASSPIASAETMAVAAAREQVLDALGVMGH